MDLGIEDKRALVMGGSYGMGNGIARALAAEGVHIYLTARSGDLLAEQAENISKEFGVQVEFGTCDLLKSGELEGCLTMHIASLAELIFNLIIAAGRQDCCRLKRMKNSGMTGLM